MSISDTHIKIRIILVRHIFVKCLIQKVFIEFLMILTQNF